MWPGNDYVYFSTEDCIILANSSGPDEMQHYAAFHLGLTISKSTNLGVSSIQRVKQIPASNMKIVFIAKQNLLPYDWTLHKKYNFLNN